MLHGLTVADALANPPKPTLGVRSPQWPAVRAAWLKIHPTCAACGRKINVDVHHIEPFHLVPEKELLMVNLISLCESPQRHCHLTFGHLLNWRSWNELVVHDAAIMLYKIKNRPAP